MPSTIVNKKLVDIGARIFDVANELFQEAAYRAAGLSESEIIEAINANRHRSSTEPDLRLPSGTFNNDTTSIKQSKQSVDADQPNITSARKIGGTAIPSIGTGISAPQAKQTTPSGE